MPIIDPTNALTTTSSQNCVALAASPRRMLPPFSDDTLHLAAGRNPLGRSKCKPRRMQSSLAQQRDGLVREDTKRPAAIDQVLPRARQCDRILPQRLDRRTNGARQMGCVVLLARAGVEQCRSPVGERIACRGEGRNTWFPGAEVRALGVR